MKLLSLLVASIRLARSIEQNHVPICKDAEYRDAAIDELCGEVKPRQADGVQTRKDEPPVQFGQGWKLS